jgi:hypothetical protein
MDYLMQHLKNMLLILATFTTSSIISTTINLDPYFTDDPYAKDADNRSIRHIIALNCDLPKKEWKDFQQQRSIRDNACSHKYRNANKKISLHQMKPDNNGETPSQIAQRKLKETGNETCAYIMAYYGGFIKGLNKKD